MRELIHSLQIVCFATRKPVDIKTRTMLMNRALQLKLDIDHRIRKETEHAYRVTEAQGDRRALMAIDQRVRELIVREWDARIEKDIMGDDYWFDITHMRSVVNYALGLTCGIHVGGFDHFVAINEKEIRVFAARNY